MIIFHTTRDAKLCYADTILFTRPTDPELIFRCPLHGLLVAGIWVGDSAE